MSKRIMFWRKLAKWWGSKNSKYKLFFRFIFSLITAILLFGILGTIVDEMLDFHHHLLMHCLSWSTIGFFVIFSISYLTEAMLTEHGNLQEMAFYDSLTGAYRRNYLPIAIEILCGRSRDTNISICVFFIDLDFLKTINDNYGHNVGDNALKTIADILKRCFNRHGDFVFRLGGDEFGAFCPCKKPQGLGDKLANLLKPEMIQFYCEGKRIPLSATFGMAYREIQQDTPLEEARELIEVAMNEADEIMYQKKQQRR